MTNRFYAGVKATHVGRHTTPEGASEVGACLRCGRERGVRAGRKPPPLCQDCKFTLSAEERALWAR